MLFNFPLLVQLSTSLVTHEGRCVGLHSLSQQWDDPLEFTSDGFMRHGSDMTWSFTTTAVSDECLYCHYWFITTQWIYRYLHLFAKGPVSHRLFTPPHDDSIKQKKMCSPIASSMFSLAQVPSITSVATPTEPSKTQSHNLNASRRLVDVAPTYTVLL